MSCEKLLSVRQNQTNGVARHAPCIRERKGERGIPGADWAVFEPEECWP